MKVKSRIVHQIFKCGICGKLWEDHTNARKKAYAHAKQTGHTVSGETGTAITYYPNITIS